LGALVWLGRRGPAALAVMVLIGVAAPPLGSALRPFVAEAVFTLLTLAFLRVDPAALGALARRPTLAVAAALWTVVATPALILGLAALGAFEGLGREMAVALLLQSVSLPMMAAPALAALIGLDATLALAGLLLSSEAMPLAEPAFLALGEAGIALSGVDLALRLAGMLAGSALLGLALSRLIGRARIVRHGAAFDGLNVVALFVFIASVMGDVGPAFIGDPWRALGLTAGAIAANLVLLGATWAAFAPFAGRRNGLAAGVLASQRNLGLMLAVAGAHLSGTVWLYFALSQIPIYLAPLVLKPLARRL